LGKEEVKPRGKKRRITSKATMGGGGERKKGKMHSKVTQKGDQPWEGKLYHRKRNGLSAE